MRNPRDTRDEVGDQVQQDGSEDCAERKEQGQADFPKDKHAGRKRYPDSRLAKRGEGTLPVHA